MTSPYPGRYGRPCQPLSRFKLSLRWDGPAPETAALLGLAADSGFDALLTVDRGFAHQQNQDDLPLPVIIMLAPSNRPAALAEPTRRIILETILQQPASHAVLGNAVRLDTLAVSKHLATLLETSLITVQDEGQVRRYALNPDPLKALPNGSSRTAAWSERASPLRHP